MTARRAKATSKAIAEPRYREIAAKLITDLHRGRYPIGELLPTEADLCVQFKASRHTVREALRIVTERGQIVRRPGAGSVVIATDPPNFFTHSVGSLAEWLRYPNHTYRQTVDASEITIDAKQAQLLKTHPGEKWFRVSSIRKSNELPDPIGWAEVYVLPKYAEVAKRRDHGRIPVHQQIEKMFGEAIEQAQLEIFASRIPAKLARSLKVPANSPALTIVRRYFGRQSGMFEVTVSIHPESRYTFSMELRREFRSAP